VEFSHAKMMMVDGCWSMIGSSNWDPRSLRLNFEFNLECHSEQLALMIEQYWNNRMQVAKLWNHPTPADRPRWMEIRDGIARLFTPLL
jgi:cardiolipin synthase